MPAGIQRGRWKNVKLSPNLRAFSSKDDEEDMVAVEPASTLRSF